MKKLKRLLIIVMMLMLLTACQTTENGNVKSETNNKGTRENPYEISDTIDLDEITPIYPYGKLDGCTFQLKFTVDQAYSPQEGISIKKQKYDSFTAVPAAAVRFELDGDYSDEINWCEVFKVSILSEEMETYSYSSFEDCDDLSEKSKIYTGFEYSYYALTNHDTSSNETPVSKYLVLEYADSNAETHSLYILLATNEDNVQEKEVSDATENEQGNENYEAAVIAEEKGYYKIAEKLYQKVGTYEDAENKYYEMKELLSQYDGTYYGDSTQYNNVKVYVYIKDGNVACQFEGQDITPDRYELYVYGDTQDGADLLAFAPARTDLFSVNNETQYGDGFAISSDGAGGYIIAATEGSTSFSWNGLFEKISDDVEEDIFE
jgi:hypothetical protein